MSGGTPGCRRYRAAFTGINTKTSVLPGLGENPRPRGMDAPSERGNSTGAPIHKACGFYVI